MKARRLAPAAGAVALALGLALAGCRGRVLTPPEEDPCAEQAPLELRLPLTTVRVGTAVPITASGGSGHYRFGLDVADGGTPGSGGEVRGDRYLAGATPGADQLWVEDLRCHTRAFAQVTVIPAFDLAPSEITVPPGTSLQLQARGLLGAAQFTLEVNASGGTLSPTGQYRAGAGTGTDLITLLDRGNGDTIQATVRVRAGATFRASPDRLAAPSGAWVPLSTADGSDRVTWRKLSGPGTLQGNVLQLEDGDTGVAVLEAADPFLNRTATANVRVLDELRRTTSPHGRLTDVAAVASADFDGDGRDDLAVGFPESDLGASQGGAVIFYRGTAQGFEEVPQWRLTGATITAQFGASLAVGDFTGDGRADLAVGAPGADITVADSGAVYLYRFAATGPQLIRGALTGLAGRGRFGSSVAAADVDGNGRADLLVGSPSADLAVANNARGVIDVFRIERASPIPDYAQIRLSGWDLNPDGTLAVKTQMQFGRSLVAADLNGDGRVDVAALGAITNAIVGGVPVSRAGVEIYLGRAPDPTGNPFAERPDVMLAPTNLADTGEGTYRLGFVPTEGARPPLLLVMADQADSPDLSASGGNRAASNAGGALLFDLTPHAAPAGEPPAPAVLSRDAAYARFYGDVSGMVAGRSFAVADVDGTPGLELLMGAPFVSNTFGGTNARLSGRVLQFPLLELVSGTVSNKPATFIGGLNAPECFGAGLGPFRGGVAVVASRASTPAGSFTGQVEALTPGSTAGLANFARQLLPLPARAADEQFGLALAGARNATGAPSAVVASPGLSGPGSLNDGNDLRAGRAYTYDLTAPATETVAAEGAASPLIRGGRETGADVSFTDFDGDGRQDVLIGAPNLVIPSTGNRATDITPHYATEVSTCVASSATTGGVRVHLGMPDGTWRPAYRLWATPTIAGCTGTGCARSQIGRAVAGGFDFNGDGRQDVAATRSNGLEVFLGRPPDDPTLGKLTMACDPAWTATFTTGTGSPTPLGDLDADGCDELAFRVANTTQSSFVIAFGFDPGGTRCGGRTAAAWLRLADREVTLPFLGTGVAFTRAGQFFNDGRDYVAVSASRFPVAGVAQDALLFYDAAAIAARRPASGELLIGAYGDGLNPVQVVYPTRIQGLGRALAGGVDITGDGRPELAVGAPGASFTTDGAGAVLILRGGNAPGVLQEVVRIVGDSRERSNFGAALALVRPSGPSPAYLLLGAFTSFRTGTQNGTAYALPMGF